MKVGIVVYQYWGKEGVEEVLRGEIGGMFSVFIPHVGNAVIIGKSLYEVTFITFDYDRETVYIKLK